MEDGSDIDQEQTAEKEQFAGMSGACFVIWEMSKKCEGVFEHVPVIDVF